MAYIQHNILTNATGLDNYRYGSACSLRGYYLVVGERGNNAAYLYKRGLNEEWSQIKDLSLLMSGFGCSVDMDDGYIVIGAENENGDKGEAAIYKDDGGDTWSNYYTVVGSDAVSGSLFGSSVSISGAYLVVGAPGDSSSKGAIYIFKRNSTNNTNGWTQYQKIVSEIPTIGDYFGASVAFDGEDIIVGATGNSNGSGAAYVYSFDSDSEVWQFAYNLYPSNREENAQFGGSISVSSSYLAIGAQYEDANSIVNSGAVYVYKKVDRWYEVEKVTGVNENSYEGNRFGCSVELEGDFLIVGSVGSDDKGVADVFYKKRDWGHLKKIYVSGLSTGDSFGSSVTIYNRFLAVGADASSAGSSGEGKVYIFEDPLIRLRLAQEFEVNGEFVPTKASVYLRRVGSNSRDYWSLYNTEPVVIDATNYSSISTRSGNILYFADTVGGSTGNGYMILHNDNLSRFPVVCYPIKAVNDDTYDLWIRCISLESNTISMEILLDGEVVRTLNETLGDPSAEQWQWVNTTVTIPDNQEHSLGIRIKEKQCAIDKIYIGVDSETPYAEGPNETVSPYVTIHMQLYESSNNPSNPLLVYDYKNTINQVVQDDWYNFNITRLDDDGNVSAATYGDNYFLVMSSAGGDVDNFVIWETVDNDEYMSFPSAIKI